MANLISSVDALFSYYGATLFVLGLLCCFTKRTFKFGVLTLLLADIPLALAIAFPRKVIEQLNSWGFQAQDFPDVQTGHTYGIIAGVVTFVVLFAIRYLLNSMLSKRKVIAQKSDNSDDAPIDIAEDDPSINQSSADNKIFKGLAIKGKKSHQSASALHLSSDDNPLNLADTQAEFSALKKNDEHGELANNLGSEPSFAQDPHEAFSLGQVPDHDSNDMKEPTLSSDVFTNHMSHNEPSFSNSFIENASLGSLKHNYAAVQKPLENQGSVGIASLGVQNPLTGQTDNKEQSGSSSWSSLFSKINQAQENTNSSALQERFSSLEGDDSFSGYGPKSKSIAQQALKKDHVPYIGPQVQDEGSLDLNNLSFAGNKVGDLLDAIDDPNHEDKLKERLGVKDNSSQPESAPFNFADILDSAAKRQSLEEEKELDSYDQVSMQPHNVDRIGDDNVSPAQLSEEQLAYAALGKSHKTVAEALADLDSQEPEQEPEPNTAPSPSQSPSQPNVQADTQHINSELLEGDNKKVDIGSPDPSLQIMEPTKISYLYSDPVHEDKSKDEEESPENVLDQYQGDSTNYSFSIKGVFKEKPKLSVSSFVDRTSYLGQSQYEANFHEKELEQIVNANEAKEQIAPQIEQVESNSDKAEDLKNKRDQVLAIARQVAAQISAELEAKQSSSHINKEQALDLLSNNDQEASQPSVDSSKKVAQDFAIESHHTDDAQDEAHALASLFANKKAPASTSARSASASADGAAAATAAAASVEVASYSKSLEQKLNNEKELAKQSVSGLESKSLTKVIGSQDKDKFIDAECLDLAPSEEQKHEDNKDIEIQPLNKAASNLNPSEPKAKRTVNIGASLEALKAKAKQAAQERAMAKEAAIKAQHEAEQKAAQEAAQEAALKAEKEAEQKAAQKAAQEAAQAKILAAQKAQSQAEARAYKAAQNKDHSAANNQPKRFNIQHVAASLESKSTLNNIAKRDNKVNVARDRGLSFIEKLKAQAKNASKPKADAAVLATSKATPAAPAAPAPAKVNTPAPANAPAVAAANVTAKSASGELKAQPNKDTVQDKQQLLAKANATASQKATTPARVNSKAPAVKPAKDKVEVQVPPKVATAAKTNTSAAVRAKDPALVKVQSATPAPVPASTSVSTVAAAAPEMMQAKAQAQAQALAQAPATKEAKAQATGKVVANASAKAQAMAKSKTDSGALDNKKGSPVEAVKTEVVTAKATAKEQVSAKELAPAQAKAPGKEQASGKELGSIKEQEQASAQGQVVKASLKNKKRHHKKAEDSEKIELSQEALKKDAALASMSSLDDLDEKVMISDLASGTGAYHDKQDALGDRAVHSAHAAQSVQGADAAKADGATVRKSASLKRSFGLKRNRP